MISKLLSSECKKSHFEVCAQLVRGEECCLCCFFWLLLNPELDFQPNGEEMCTLLFELHHRHMTWRCVTVVIKVPD